MATFPLLLPKVGEDFSLSSLWESDRTPWGKTHKCVCVAGGSEEWRGAKTGVPLEFLTQTCPHWAFNNSPMIVQVFLLQYWFPRGFWSNELWFSVSACVSSLGDSDSPCGPKFPRHLGEGIDSQLSFLSVRTVTSKLLAFQTRNQNFRPLRIVICYWFIHCSDFVSVNEN